MILQRRYSILHLHSFLTHFTINFIYIFHGKIFKFTNNNNDNNNIHIIRLIFQYINYTT